MGNCIIDKVGTVLTKKEGFTISKITQLSPTDQQSWDSDAEYRSHYDVEIEGITENTYVFNPIFDTASLKVLAPFLETGNGYIRLFFNVTALPYNIICRGYEVD